ncbi:hypothetical protein HUG17_3877 [Dermatophagoides farinae]|uniref:Uncharacterized protein n=1 Tax=Dermatophagoides farinae TaxID=6954 RepID=A0A9D4NXC3_DERFA|nr:hypothetical protein HUG17_3877 [Dermatophagoides farinae]
MGRKIYIGRPSEHLGRTAFQILANLKNFGIGRMLTRHEFDKFPEPSFHIVKRVQTYMDPELKFGTLWCETVIRGKRLPGIRPLTITYRPDFRLIPKDEEKEFIGDYPITNLGDNKNILPRYYQLPPLMREWMNRIECLVNMKIKAYIMPISDCYKTNNRDHGQLENLKEFLIPFVYQDKKDLRRPDADLFWIANRLAEDGEKPTIDFDGQYHFNQEYLENCKK